MALLHDAHGRVQSLNAVALIAAERHVAHHERTVHAVAHALRMVYHLVEGHGEGGGVAHHHVGCGVAHENHVYAGLVDELGHGIVVGCEHCYLFAARLHVDDARSRHFLLVVRSVCRHRTLIFYGFTRQSYSFNTNPAPFPSEIRQRYPGRGKNVCKNKF